MSDMSVANSNNEGCWSRFVGELSRLDQLAKVEENAEEGRVQEGVKKDFDMYARPIEDIKENWNEAKGCCGKIMAVAWLVFKHAVLGPIYSTVMTVVRIVQIVWQILIELPIALCKGRSEGLLQPIKDWGKDLYILFKSYVRNELRSSSIFGAFIAKGFDMIGVKGRELITKCYNDCTSKKVEEEVEMSTLGSRQ